MRRLKPQQCEQRDNLLAWTPRSFQYLVAAYTTFPSLRIPSLRNLEMRWFIERVRSDLAAEMASLALRMLG